VKRRCAPSGGGTVRAVTAAWYVAGRGSIQGPLSTLHTGERKPVRRGGPSGPRVAERLLGVVRHPILMEDESEVQVRASVGVVDDAGQDGDVIDLLEMATAATRLAQSRGSDRCEVYTADLGVRTGRRRLGRVPRDLTSLAVQRSESAVTG